MRKTSDIIKNSLNFDDSKPQPETASLNEEAEIIGTAEEYKINGNVEKATYNKIFDLSNIKNHHVKIESVAELNPKLERAELMEEKQVQGEEQHYEVESNVDRGTISIDPNLLAEKVTKSKNNKILLKACKEYANSLEKLKNELESLYIENPKAVIERPKLNSGELKREFFKATSSLAYKMNDTAEMAAEMVSNDDLPQPKVTVAISKIKNRSDKSKELRKKLLETASKCAYDMRKTSDTIEENLNEEEKVEVLSVEDITNGKIDLTQNKKKSLLESLAALKVVDKNNHRLRRTIKRSKDKIEKNSVGRM